MLAQFTAPNCSYRWETLTLIWLATVLETWVGSRDRQCRVQCSAGGREEVWQWCQTVGCGNYKVLSRAGSTCSHSDKGKSWNCPIIVRTLRGERWPPSLHPPALIALPPLINSFVQTGDEVGAGERGQQRPGTVQHQPPLARSPPWGCCRSSSATACWTPRTSGRTSGSTRNS